MQPNFKSFICQLIDRLHFIDAGSEWRHETHPDTFLGGSDTWIYRHEVMQSANAATVRLLLDELDTAQAEWDENDQMNNPESYIDPSGAAREIEDLDYAVRAHDATT